MLDLMLLRRPLKRKSFFYQEKSPSMFFSAKYIGKFRQHNLQRTSEELDVEINVSI